MKSYTLRKIALGLTALSTIWLLLFFAIIMLPIINALGNLTVAIEFSVIWVITLLPFSSLGILGISFIVYSWILEKQEKIKEIEKVLPRQEIEV